MSIFRRTLLMKYLVESSLPITPPASSWISVEPTYNSNRRIGSDNKLGNHSGDALTIYQVYEGITYYFDYYTGGRFGFFTSTSNGALMVESTSGADIGEYTPSQNGYLIATNNAGTHLNLNMKYREGYRVYVTGDLFCGRDGQVTLYSGKVYEQVNESRASIFYPVLKGKEYIIANGGNLWSYGFVDSYPHNNQTYEHIDDTGVLFTPDTDGYIIAYRQAAVVSQNSQVSYYI